MEMANLEHERLHNIEIIQIILSTFYWGTTACTILVPGWFESAVFRYAQTPFSFWTHFSFHEILRKVKQKKRKKEIKKILSQSSVMLFRSFLN